MTNLRLSPKHGLNPSILKCPICGKDTGIALLGKLKGDAKAPKEMNDEKLCEDCKKEYITLLLTKSQEPKLDIIGRAYIRRQAVSEQFRNSDCLCMIEGEFKKLQQCI